MLTEEELKALSDFSIGLLGIYALPTCHVADNRELEFHVHAIQNIVMSRAAVRAHPGEFRHVEYFK